MYEGALPNNSGATVNLAPAATSDRPQEWWERGLPLLPAMLALALVGTYLTPINPDIAPYAVVWVVVCAICTAYIAMRVGRAFGPLKRQEVSYKPDGTTVVKSVRRKQPGVLVLINVGVSGAMLAAVYRGLATSGGMHFGNFLPFGETAVGLLTGSLVMVGLFTLVWSRRTSASNLVRLLNNHTILVVLPLALLCYLGPLFFLQSSAFGGMIGPSASWPRLLGFAQHEAARIDGNAVLEHVIASPAYNASKPYSSQNTVFEAAFVFRRPNGASIRLVALDSDPPRLQEVENPWDSASFGTGNNSSVLSDTLLSYAQRLAYVKIGPRDAYRLTEAEGLHFAQERMPGQSPAVEASMFLEPNWQGWFGVPAGWNIKYTVERDGKYESLGLQVDGATGQVLARAYSPQDAQCKSCPPQTPRATPTHTPGR